MTAAEERERRRRLGHPSRQSAKATDEAGAQTAAETKEADCQSPLPLPPMRIPRPRAGSKAVYARGWQLQPKGWAGWRLQAGPPRPTAPSEIGEGEGALEEATTATPVLALCMVEMSYLTSRRP